MEEDISKAIRYTCEKSSIYTNSIKELCLSIIISCYLVGGISFSIFHLFCQILQNSNKLGFHLCFGICVGSHAIRPLLVF